MKKNLLWVLALFFVVADLNAQFKKGMRMAGATIGAAFFNSGKTEVSFPAPTTGYTSNNDNYGISLNPELGWFISDNTVVGGGIIFSLNKSKTADVSGSNGNTFNKDNSTRFSAGLSGYLRNYFNTSGSMLPFGQVNLNFGTGNTSTDGFSFNGNDKSTYTGKSSGDFFTNAGLSFGMTKMINPHTGLDFFVGYAYSSNKSSFKKTTSVDQGNNGSVDVVLENNPTQKYTNHGISLGVSFQIFLEKKK